MHFYHFPIVEFLPDIKIFLDTRSEVAQLQYAECKQ